MNSGSGIKIKVAKEAAALLYFGAEKEYKQAKLKAAKNLGVKFLPSNLEVALELDKLAEENEGHDRAKRLVLMRKEALDLMKLLEPYSPVLIGSVWRGTIHRGSDIDLAVYADLPEEIIKILKANHFKIFKTELVKINKQGMLLESFHIYTKKTVDWQIEITVRSIEEKGKKRKCEIFGDTLKGLKRKELQKILEENPTKRFLP